MRHFYTSPRHRDHENQAKAKGASDGKGVSARAATGICLHHGTGAVWDSLRCETRRCLGLATSRNRALPEICYATERGTKSTAASIGYGAATSIGEELEGGGAAVAAISRWQMAGIGGMLG